MDEKMAPGMNVSVREKPEHSFFERVRNSASSYVTFSLSLLLAFLTIRFIEFISIFTANGLPQDLPTVVAQALLSDSITYVEMLPILFIPFIFLCLITSTSRYRYRAYGVMGSVVIIFYALLVKYFATTLVPLGSDLFGYSLKEIAVTVQGGVTLDSTMLILIFLPLILFWISLVLLSSFRLIVPFFAFAVLGTGMIMIFTVSAMPDGTALKSELSYGLAVNKAAFFSSETYRYCSRSTPGPVSAITWNKEKRPDNAAGFKYVDPEYPFLRTDETPDVLGPFFKVDATKPPNLVFILVEGLGKAFSGPHAYLGSFTPFLDGLAEKSLYWENFLATQGRTFAALPSILASLPYAEQGFNDLGQRMPKHLSLMSILKHSGYRIKFYFGSDLNFDNERMFLERQGVQVMVGINDYEKKYAKNPGTSWGYADRELMMKSIEMDSKDSQQPYLSFIQTMSMHTSYSIPDQERYIRLFEEHMDRMSLDDAQKELHRPYDKIYSTIMYTDDALRYFFEEYAKLQAYGNTIFIITGDHRLPEIPMSTKIDRFHVPLIIYSPLLKRAAHFQSISSHLDIAPSLLAFLKRNYHINAPATVTWVGSGLDTDPSFRNIHRSPLKHTKTNLIDYLSGMYFIDQDVLFSVGKSMDLEPVQDEGKRKALIAEFNEYKTKNDRFTRELRLMPDKLYEQFHP